MTTHAIVLRRLVPYQDARLTAAAKRVDIMAIETIGQAGEEAWSEASDRTFDYVSLAANETEHVKSCLWAALDKVAPQTVAVQGWADAFALAAIQWALERDTRLVLFSESNIHDHDRQIAKEWIKSRIVSVCDSALVGGEGHLAYLEQLGFERQRIAFGYNVVDNNHFARPVCENHGRGEPYFLTVSRLISIKNIDHLLRAYSAYRDRSPGRPWQLRILGVGELEAELKTLARSLHIDAYVDFAGFRQYEDLPQIYHNAGALIHVSISEPWGPVVNEAMAAGVPVIVSDRCGSACTLIRDGENGFVTPAKDLDLLVERMVQLSGLASLRTKLAARGIQTIADWSPDRFGAGYREAVDIATTQPYRRGNLNSVFVRLFSKWR